jgi:hypothetical protein
MFVHCVCGDGMGDACSTHGGNTESAQNIGRKLEGKRLLGRSRQRLQDNVKMDVKETVIEVSQSV